MSITFNKTEIQRTTEQVNNIENNTGFTIQSSSNKCCSSFNSANSNMHSAFKFALGSMTCIILAVIIIEILKQLGVIPYDLPIYPFALYGAAFVFCGIPLSVGIAASIYQKCTSKKSYVGRPISFKSASFHTAGGAKYNVDAFV